MKQTLIALDQLAYVLLTMGAGHQDETLSAAAWRVEQKGRLLGRLSPAADRPAVCPLEQHHCRKAFEAEVPRAQLHRDYRSTQ